MMKSFCAILLITTFSYAYADWYEHTIFYQIYPRSFMDSNGDGIGDLQGIISKLEHLQEAGVGGTWLSPIFSSPMVDFGYDISNFTDVDPVFGTIDDLKALITKAKTLGIKIILDFVPNHSSDQCEWFRKSINREDGFDDWYVWADSKGEDENGDPIPPNNWQCVFYGSAWEWNEIRGQFYLHQFATEQPDLNFHNPAVVEEMKNVLRFWLEMGADGFRVDAINHLFEDPTLPDEPLTGEPDPNSYGYTHHIYTKDMDETYEMIYTWRTLLDEWQQVNGGETRIMMTEAYASTEQVMRYYQSADGTKQGSHMPFNFVMINSLYDTSAPSDFKRVTDDWIAALPNGKVANWVLGNHDQPRVGTRYGSARIEGLLTIVMGLPGVAVTYYGEEIGMVNNFAITWEETVDPQACRPNNSDIYQNLSRDPERTPFQWDTTTSAGFSTNSKTWLPVHENYVTLNLKAQNEAEKSVWKYYKELTKLRKEETLINGNYESKVSSDNKIFMFRRSLTSSNTDFSYVYVINFDNNIGTADISGMVDNIKSSEIIAAASISIHEVGHLVDPTKIELGPYDAIVLNIIESSATTVFASMGLLFIILLKSLCF